MDLYKDIESRTRGEIYIGVVGPVRTGKSTFIKRFMDLLVIPNMEDVHSKERTKDELPQSAAGKTIMTTEPKFIPKDGAKIKVSENTTVKVRLIDCVGYMVEGAAGHIENDEERMVKTPWYDYDIPFSKAAEIGTKKVISDHSTIGVIVTTDGSFGEIPGEQYIPALERTINEMKSLNKPFVVLLNSSRPESEETENEAVKMATEYGVCVLPVNCKQMKKEDVNKILYAVLNEFPVYELRFIMQGWIEMLRDDHSIKESLIQLCRKVIEKVHYMKDVTPQLLEDVKGENPYVESISTGMMDMSAGIVNININVAEENYYNVLSEFTGQQIRNEYELIETIKILSSKKAEFEKVSEALNQVRTKGYSVIIPSKDEISIEEPSVIKNGAKYGVKIKAEAPSIHMIKANVQTEIAPIVGDETQAKDLKGFIIENGNRGIDGIFETNIFGKTIEQIVTDGIKMKIDRLSEETQVKMQDTLQKITNDSRGGVICIIL